jgi:DNA-binding IclR family transcriptional regulator
VQRDDETGRFRLGLGLIALSGTLLAELDVRRVAYPELERLTEATLETSALAVWNGSEAVVVEQIPSPHQVKHTAAIGTRYSKFESSSVRVFLAALPGQKAASLLEQGLVALKPGSDLAADFADQLRKVREAGYAVNDGLTTPEEFGISAPVRDYKGAVVGCITASAPKSRVPDSVVDELAASVVAAAVAVSARLGHSGPESPAGAPK